MTRYRRCFAVVCATLAIVTPLATAKRVTPKPVPPVVADGVQYSAEGDGKNQYVVATDVSSGKQLWKVRVFHTPIKSSVEEDVQWVFVTDLKLIDNSVFVRDEKARCYAIPLSTHRVRKAPCGTVFTRPETLTP